MEVNGDNTSEENAMPLNLRDMLAAYWQKWPLILAFSLIGLAAAYLWNKTVYDRFEVEMVINVKAEDQSLISTSPISFLNRNDNLIDPKIAALESFEHNMRVARELEWEVSYYYKNLISSRQTYGKSSYTVEIDKAYPQVINVPIYIKPKPTGFELSVEDDFLEDKVKLYDYTNQTFSSGPLEIPLNTEHRYNEWIESGSIRIKVSLTNEALLNDPGDHYFRLVDYETLAKANRETLRVSTNNLKGSFNNSGIMTISAQGYSKDRLAGFLNTTIQILQVNELENKNARINRTIDFIDQQLTYLVDSLQQAEKALQAFRSDNQVVDLSAEAGQIFTQLIGLEQEKAELILTKDYYQYLQNQLTNSTDISEVSLPSVTVTSNPAITNLTGQLTELNLQRTNAAFSLKPENPIFQNIEKQIRDVAKQLRDNVTSLIETNKIALDKVEARISEIENQFTDIPQTEQTLINLRKRYELISNLYTILLERRSDAAITRSSNTTDIQIIDPARDIGQSPIGPSRLKNLIIGLLLGVIVPIGFIGVGNYFNNKVDGTAQIKARYSFPIMGEIVHSSGKESIVPLDNSKLITAEGFRSLRTNIQFIVKKPDVKTMSIMVSSGISGEGKTFISNNLGNVLVKNNKSVLIITADLRKSNSLEPFGIKPNKGLSNYLANQATKEEIIIKTEIPNLKLIASGPPPPNPSELIMSDTFSNLLKSLTESQEFDYIIIDTPPILLFSDALHMSTLSDHCLYVVRQGVTRTSSLGLISEKHKKGFLKNVSLVVNDIKMKRTQGYYGYGHSYYRGYSSYGYGMKNRKGLSRFFKRKRS